MKVKYYLIVLSVLSLVKASNAQDCKSLPPGDDADLCYVQLFLYNSPINDKLTDRDFKYNTGKGEYYPTGKNVPWGGYYMPFKEGGIAVRWRTTPIQIPKSNNLFTWEQIQNMSQDRIAKLSPAEKMDIYLGNKDFIITRTELKNRGPEKPDVQSWEGFCNGNRLAGTMLPEPERVIIVKSQNVEKDVFVTFYPADLKALANAAYYYTQWYAQVGEQNRRKPDAGTFDILLRTLLGEQRRTFFMDIRPDDRKFNEAIVGYKREILGVTPVGAIDTVPVGTLKIVDVKTTLYLLGEVSLQESNFPTKSKIQNKEYVKPYVTQYRLFVDSNDNIIKGKWGKLDNVFYSNYLEYPDALWLASGIGVDHYEMYKNQAGNPYLPFFEVQNLFLLASQF